MNKTLKRFLMLLTIIVLIGGSLYQNRQKIPKKDDVLQKQAQAYVTQLQEQNIIPKANQEASVKNRLFKDDTLVPYDVYGGVYIDTYHEIHISVADEDIITNLKKALKKQKTSLKVHTHLVKYTVYDLDQVQLKLVDAAIFELDGVVNVYRDVEINKVIITAIKEDFDLNELMHVIDRLNIEVRMLRIIWVDDESDDAIPRYLSIWPDGNRYG